MATGPHRGAATPDPDRAGTASVEDTRSGQFCYLYRLPWVTIATGARACGHCSPPRTRTVSLHFWAADTP